MEYAEKQCPAAPSPRASQGRAKMGPTISDALTAGVFRGLRRLDGQAARDLRDFLASRIDRDSGLFLDRSGRPDLYYTAFGLLLDRLAGFRLADRALVRRRLAALAPLAMTLPELRAYVQTRALARAFPFGWPPSFVRGRVCRAWRKISGRRSVLADWRESRERSGTLASACPQDNPRSPYSLFLFLALAQDLADDPGFTSAEIRDALEAHRAADIPDAYAGAPRGAAALNATLSALMVLRHGRWPEVRVPPSSGGGEGGIAGAIAFIQSCQLADGAFAASPSAPEADLLSTGLALFALRQFHAAAFFDPRPALAEFFPEGGCFTATRRPEDVESDTEYAFYGLLAMGCCEWS